MSGRGPIAPVPRATAAGYAAVGDRATLGGTSPRYPQENAAHHSYQGQNYTTQSQYSPRQQRAPELVPVYSHVLIPFGNSNKAADPSLDPRNVVEEYEIAKKKKFEYDLKAKKDHEATLNQPRPDRLPNPKNYPATLEEVKAIEALAPYSAGDNQDLVPVTSEEDADRREMEQAAREVETPTPPRPSKPFIPRAVAQRTMKESFEELHKYFMDLAPKEAPPPERDEWGTLTEPKPPLAVLDVYGDPVAPTHHPDLYAQGPDPQFQQIFTRERPDDPKEAYDLDWGLFMVSKDERPYRLGTVQQLLRHHADPNAVDEYGMTPMHHAAAFGKVELLELFRFYGADPDTPDSIGWTPLYFAARNNEIEAVRLLLQMGANPVRKTQRGRTARMLAVERGHWECAKVLRQAQQELGLDEKEAKKMARDGPASNLLFGALSAHVFGKRGSIVAHTMRDQE